VTLPRVLLAITVVLLFAITTTSAHIRLSPADAAELVLVRGLHRIVATVAGVWLLVLVALAWSDLRSVPQRIALISLVVLAGLLAWLGLVTPSELPAVTLANLLGGMAMLALAAALHGAVGGVEPSASMRRPPRSLIRWQAVAIGAVLLQIGWGGMIAARGAAAACADAPLCGTAWIGTDSGWAVLDPFRGSLDDVAAQAVAHGQRALHAIHRLLGIATVAAVAYAALRTLGTGVARTWSLVALASVAVQPLLGAGIASGLDTPMLMLAHNVTAALVLSSLSVAAGASAAAAGASDRLRRSDRRFEAPRARRARSLQRRASGDAT